MEFAAQDPTDGLYRIENAYTNGILFASKETHTTLASRCSSGNSSLFHQSFNIDKSLSCSSLSNALYQSMGSYRQQRKSFSTTMNKNSFQPRMVVTIRITWSCINVRCTSSSCSFILSSRMKCGSRVCLGLFCLRMVSPSITRHAVVCSSLPLPALTCLGQRCSR